MYRCELCQEVVAPRTKTIRIPVETRAKQYPNRTKTVNAGRGRKKEVTVHGGTGFEIVREIVICPACAVKRKKEAQQAAAAV